MVDITFGRGRGKCAAIVDLALGGVSISVVEVRNGASNVLGIGHSALSAETRPKKQAVGLLAQQIKEAGDIALKMYADLGHKAAVDTVYVFVHAPWTHSQTVTVSKKYDTDTLVSEKILADFAKEAFAMAKDIDAAHLLEASVVRVEINGYHVQKPEGTYARTIDMMSLISDCDETVKKNGAGAVGALFPVAKVLWRSGARAIATFLDSTPLVGKDVLVFDMTADSTQVISIRQDSFEETLIEEGVGTILGRISAGRMSEEVLGHIRMLNREACSNEACEAVEAAMATAEPELARIFGEAIAKMAALRHVPNDLVLITHQDLESWLGRFFTRIDFSQFTITTLPFEVHTPGSLGVSTRVRGDHQDPALSVDASLVNTDIGS